MIAIIPARGGSRRLPGKNKRLMAGRPLICWTIAAALDSRIFQDILVSTEDDEIGEIARDAGCPPRFKRPMNLALDSSGSAEVVIHALEWWKCQHGSYPDSFMLLQPTSPLRTAADMALAASQFEEKLAESLISVTTVPKPLSILVKVEQDGRLFPYFPIEKPVPPVRSQPSPHILNGAIYLNRVSSFLKSRAFEVSGAVAFPMPPERSIDIDNELEFSLAELLLKQQLESSVKSSSFK
jgi:CMP-N,N'-diacetyllegionaminic acid synthase